MVCDVDCGGLWWFVVFCGGLWCLVPPGNEDCYQKVLVYRLIFKGAHDLANFAMPWLI